MMLRVTTEQIEQALIALRAGKIIVYPSETSYAIGCDARNSEAVDRIFAIKGRKEDKALPVIIPNTDVAHEYVEITPVFEILADAFWPGALNIIADSKKDSPIALRCSSQGTQSVRVSSHPFVSTLIHQFGFPIVATSANISGQDAIYEVKKIKEIFADNKEQPDVFIDGGDLPKLPASTTVKILDQQHVVVVRQGKIEIPQDFLA